MKKFKYFSFEITMLIILFLLIFFKNNAYDDYSNILNFLVGFLIGVIIYKLKKVFKCAYQ